MRHPLFLALFAGAALAPGLAGAQGQPPAPPPQGAAATVAPLSLADALSLAHRNNPDYLSTANNARVAGAQLRSAYGAMIPNVDASFGSSYREGLQQLIGGQRFGAVSDQVSSSYDLSVTARYNAATFIQPKLERANVRAAEADAVGVDSRVRGAVTQQYLTVLQQQARATLQDSLVANARIQLLLAQARAQVGVATDLEVSRAQVAVGQAEVAAIQARSQIGVEKVRLFQQMGVDQPSNDADLTTRFEVSDPTFTLEQVLSLAVTGNPTLQATRSRQDVADLALRNAHAQYTPTLSLSTGLGGYTNQYTDNGYVLSQATNVKQSLCAQNAQTPAEAAACSTVALTPSEAAQARNQNSQYPFSFSRNPYQVQAQLSIPIFNGFSREARVQEAAANRNDARFSVRAQELALRTDVTSAYLTLTSALSTARLQEQNAATARQALTLAEERYKVGANSSVEVTQARADYERAENDRINAIYDFHKAYAALESAVGRPLR